MLVKISNGVETFVVTKGAFDGIFSRQGYFLVDEVSDKEIDKSGANRSLEAQKGIPEEEIEEIESESEQEVAEEMTEEEKEDDDINFCLELEEKPISQWHKAEIKRYAEINEIDITETKSIAEARDVIKGYLK